MAKLYYTGLLINIAIVFEPPSDAGDLDIDLGEDDLFGLARKFTQMFSLKQQDTDDFNNVFDFDDVDYTDDSSTNTPNGALVILHPEYAVQFATGFLIGSNLTGQTETLYTCESTLSNDIMAKTLVFSDNILSTQPPKLFTAAYAMWDIFYYSESLVYDCTLLGEEMKINWKNTMQNLWNISKLLNNVSNNYDNAFSSYTDVKSFM